MSVLFKNYYKPYAHLYDQPEMWPEPMFWNDAASHQRLQKLTNLWEKDIFDECSIRTLLDHLKPGHPIREVLDRLAFMSSFGAFIPRDSIGADNDKMYAQTNANARSIPVGPRKKSCTSF